MDPRWAPSARPGMPRTAPPTTAPPTTVAATTAPPTTAASRAAGAAARPAGAATRPAGGAPRPGPGARRHTADAHTAEIATHHKPARRFQIFGVFLLVAGAVAGAYAGFGRHLGAANPSALSAETVPILPDAQIGEEKAAARALAKSKAEAAAAEEAERARKANEIAAREQEAASRSQTRTAAPPVPSSCNEYTGNRAVGCALMLEAGYALEEMSCLDAMWTKESHWNEAARNASSGAYGIPQALPGDKMAVYGADWQTNPVPQIRWGLNYIKTRYSSPCGAWSYWQAHGWY